MTRRTLALLLLLAAPVAADSTLPGDPELEKAIACARARRYRRAIEAWCDGAPPPVARRYYQQSLARTRRHACEDVLNALPSCDLDLNGSDDRPTVQVRMSDADVTYWEVSLVRRGRAWRVDNVDFLEDCTGP